ncbi:hypothetical protein F5Y11DRAFT_5278 [Daldinia sp. FL1419]|nr:hypothetical protein F5Y11DRAFT_5278 [Daldinia sp. FL1419]
MASTDSGASSSCLIDTWLMCLIASRTHGPPQSTVEQLSVLRGTYCYNIVVIVIGVNADAVIRRLSKTIATKNIRTGICPY